MSIYPLVSVAVITYNQEKYISDCLDSILDQDYPNIEVIVADDFSIDSTYSILKEYEFRFPNKVKIVRPAKNNGITRNSNLAFKACSGKYIAWMGGDDLMCPFKLSKQVHFMELNPNCAISYHNLDVFDSNTGITLFYFNKKNKINGNIKTLIKKGSFNGACSNLTRATCCPKNGFNELIPVASDWLFWIETLENGSTINYIDETLGRYRRHENNVTKANKFISQNELDHLNTCNILLTKYPFYFNSILEIYSIKVRDLRFKIPYTDCLMFSLRINFNLKSFFALMIFFLSFKSIKV